MPGSLPGAVRTARTTRGRGTAAAPVPAPRT